LVTGQLASPRHALDSLDMQASKQLRCLSGIKKRLEIPFSSGITYRDFGFNCHNIFPFV